MIHRPLRNATLLAGLGCSLFAMSSCSAETSTPPPMGTGGASSGATNTAATGVTTTSATGVTSTTGSSTTGGSTDTCDAPPADGSAPLIDDFADGDHIIAPNEGRLGYWYQYNDGSGTQSSTPINGSASATGMMESSGGGFTGWGAGVGVDLNNDNTAMMSCVYNASAYQGVSFTVNTNVTLRFRVSIPETTESVNGGTCMADCNDMHGFAIDPTTAPTPFMVPFASGLAQEGWGAPATFDATRIMQLSWQVVSPNEDGMGIPDFSFSVDDVSFF